MDIISMTRELGKMIQQEEAYVNLHTAEKNADADQTLQDLIKEFNLKRLSINNETQKAEKDSEKIAELNSEMQKIYGDIMSNENMIAYNDAKQAFDQIMTRIMTIIQNCSEGQDPETTDYTASCSGSCATCGGCG